MGCAAATASVHVSIWFVIYSTPENQRQNNLFVFRDTFPVRNHPVLKWPPEQRAKAIAISIHGDEGTGKRSRSVLILSWSSMAVSDVAMRSKYPFCVPCPVQQDTFGRQLFQKTFGFEASLLFVCLNIIGTEIIKSEYFAHAAGGTVNHTLSDLQRHLVESLNLASDPSRSNGWTLHVAMGKGDWKWRKEWLMQGRSYMNAAGKNPNSQSLICPRCFAGSAERPWLDSTEAFANPEDLAAAKDTCALCCVGFLMFL